ncbi:MAG: DUF1427 family protein [Candidatus Binatia bacterium]
MKTALAFLISFGIGFTCRALEIPVPSPHKLIGALLVVAITLGYIAADRLLGGPGSAPKPHVTKQ